MSAAKSTLGKQGDLCRRGSKNTTGIYDSPVPRTPPFLNTPTRPAKMINDLTNLKEKSGLYCPSKIFTEFLC